VCFFASDFQDFVSNNILDVFTNLEQYCAEFYMAAVFVCT